MFPVDTNESTTKPENTAKTCLTEKYCPNIDDQSHK